MKYRYSEDIPLQLQVWLATDSYTGASNPNAISATTLLKPVKSLILSKRVEAAFNRAITNGESSLLNPKDKPELTSFLKSRMGTAMHDSVESAWKDNYVQALTNLGYQKSFIDRIVINPDSDKDLAEDAITIFTEKRLERKLGKYEVSGELDFCMNTIINDLKTTSTYSYKFQSDYNHRMQMSIYRWIFKGNGFDISNIAQVNYIFNDWSPYYVGAPSKPWYPKTNPCKAEVELFNTLEVEEFIAKRINQIKASKGVPEPQLIPCTPEDLWQDESRWAVYKDPSKVGGKATRVFDEYTEAVQYNNDKGGGCSIQERPGKVKRCNFCSGASLCTQKDTYIQSGLLEFTQ